MSRAHLNIPSLLTPSVRLVLGLALASMLTTGCSPRVPETPEIARAQTPRGAPIAPWQGKGRLEVYVPLTGSRISCTAILRGMGDGSARAVFMSDEGLILADISASDGMYTVNQSIAALADALPHLGRMVAQAFAAPPAEVRTWDDGRLIAQVGDDQRWYGGDPLLLRCVTGHGFDIYFEDYRQLGGELLAWEVRGEGPLGITLRIRLQEAQRPKAQPAISAPGAR